MKIDYIELSNFKCFREESTKIKLENDLTFFLGNNGTGKTVSLLALRRLFGNTREERTIVKDDFYLSDDESFDDIYGRELFIDVVFSFPELGTDSAKSSTTCPAFSSVIFADNDGMLKARIRLEAKWDETEYEDEVQSKVYWVMTGGRVAFGDVDPNKHAVSAYDRKQINIRYIPATRDAKSTLKDEIRKLTKLLSDYSETDSVTKEVESLGSELNDQIRSLESIKTVSKKLEKVWTTIHDNSISVYQKPNLEYIPSDITSIIKSLVVKLSPTEGGENKDISELSDGQISLFYFALSLAVYQIEQSHIVAQAKGFRVLDKDLPVFTIFAFEEPENHLSPFYLGRVIKTLNDSMQSELATGIITSHSPNVVRRANSATRIRHFRQQIEQGERFSIVKEVKLPNNKASDDYKYINQAILANPELYFSKLVILGEGDSEEIVIPQIAQVMGLDLDPSFISFVQLGGRHVNHMWRLLNELSIPYITLLDYDLGRFQGGPPRIKNVIDRLGELTTINPANLPDSTDLTGNAIAFEELEAVLDQLKKLNVFFSLPLDLDMAMIKAFPDHYKADNARASKDRALRKSVLGKKGNYDAIVESGFDLSNEEMTKYRYLFKSKSKVASHYIAMEEISQLPKEEIIEQCPQSIISLINKSVSMLSAETE